MHYVYKNQHQEREEELKLSKSKISEKLKSSKKAKSRISAPGSDLNSAKSNDYDCEKGLKFINNELSFENTFPSVNDFFGSYCNNDHENFR